MGRIILGDCIQELPKIENNSVHLLLSDIPYGIGAEDWDVLHSNTNSAYMGSSPSQKKLALFLSIEENLLTAGLRPIK